MKILLSAKEINTPLQTVIGVVEKKQTLPILAHVLFSLKDNTLTISATDMEIEIKAISQIQCSEEIEFTIYAKTLIDIVRNLDETTEIEITINENKIDLKINKSKFSLNSLESKQFPKLPEITDTNSININKKHLKTLVDKVSFSMGSQDIRSYLNGILLKIDNENITIVATDGHRLAIGTREQANDLLEESSIILPKKTVTELQRILNNELCGEEVNLMISETYIVINVNNEIILKSRLIDSQFPDYNKIIPEDLSNVIKINRDSFLSCLHQAAIFVNEKTKAVNLIFKNNNLEINTNSERGKADVNLTINTNVEEELNINFNIDYIITVINKLSTNEIHFIMPKDNASSLFSNDDNLNFKYIIMPLKV
jgi:DNA polymerase-3 subunit beta